MKYDDLKATFPDIETIWEMEGVKGVSAAMRFDEGEEDISMVVWYDAEESVTGVRLMTSVGQSRPSYLAFVTKLCLLLDGCFGLTLEQRGEVLKAIGISDPKAPGGEYADDRVTVRSSLAGSVYGVDVMWA